VTVRRLWRGFWRGLSAHWGLKLIALALATMIWASYAAEPSVEVGIAVPVEFRNVPGDLEIATGEPLDVVVRVRGRATTLRRLTPAEVSVVMDLRSVGTGEVSLLCDTSMVQAPYGVTVLRIEPQQVHVTLIPRASVPAAR
jgi:YbbR domain-containing protein